jgi:hypothetical protein
MKSVSRKLTDSVRAARSGQVPSLRPTGSSSDAGPPPSPRGSGHTPVATLADTGQAAVPLASDGQLFPPRVWPD